MKTRPDAVVGGDDRVAAVLADSRGLAALQPEWEALFAAQPKAHLACSFALVQATATRAHDPGEWRCHLRRAEGRLEGAVYGRRTSLTPLGLRIPIFSAGTEFASDPLLRTDSRDEAGTLLEQLLDAESDCALLQFGRLSETAFLALRDAARHRDLFHACAHAPYGYAWDTSAAAPELEARLGSSSRQLMRRTQRKFARDFTPGFVRLATRDSAANLDMLDRFITLEAAGWKGREGTAIGNKPGNPEYFRAIVEAGAGSGLMQWYTLEANGQTVAMFMCMRTHDTLWMPKIAFDERFSEYRPGHELLRRVLLDCQEDDTVNTLNFIGAPEWLDNWRPVRQPHFELRVFTRTLNGRAVAALDRFRKSLRSARTRESMEVVDQERRFL